jgi:glycosyltransferase involved in cell wall biosynthesis
MVGYTDYASDARIRREAEALVARGDVVDLICPDSDLLAGRTSLGGVNLHLVREREYRKTGPLRYLARYALFMLAAAARVARLGRANRIDLVMVHTMPDFLVFAAWPAKRRGAGVILDVHDLVPELYESKFGLRSSHPIVRLLTWTERRSIAFADAAFAVHSPHRDAIVSHGTPAEKLTEVMNAPDLSLLGRPQDETEIDPSLVVYHGTIARRHGLESLVRAIDLARREGNDARLFLAGDGEDAGRIEDLIHELGLNDVTTFHRGWMQLEDLVPKIRRAQAAVIPLVPDAFTRYMLPVKLFEYAALHIPVIVTRTSTIEAYFDDTCVAFVDTEDPEAIAREIADIARDSNRRQAMTANAAKVVERHSWDEERKRYLAVVDEVLRKSHAPVVAGERVQVEAR